MTEVTPLSVGSSDLSNECQVYALVIGQCEVITDYESRTCSHSAIKIVPSSLIIKILLQKLQQYKTRLYTAVMLTLMSLAEQRYQYPEQPIFINTHPWFEHTQERPNALSL